MIVKKLVCGVGINDADYVVRKDETVGYVNGKQKRKWCGSALTIKLGQTCLIVVTLPNIKIGNQRM